MSTTPQNIREFLDREPFKPFRLVMSSGKTYDIVTANSAMLLKSEVFVVYPDGEHWAHVPFLHISSFETSRNGKTKRNGLPCRKRG